MDLAVAVLAGLVAVEYLVIGFFIVPRLARLADGRAPGVVLLAQVGAAAFFFGCAVTHTTVLVQDRATAVTYSGTWTKSVYANASGGSTTYATSLGARARTTFSG